MAGRKETQIGIYTWYFVILAVAFLGSEGQGLRAGCSLLQRIGYPFFHQNVFHAVINIMVLHQCLRCIPCTWNLLVFYLITISYPFTTDKPIVGLSGLVYAYMGYLAPYVVKKVKYNLTILCYILVGLLLPNMAIGVHIYCYILGMLWGYLNVPICRDE